MTIYLQIIKDGKSVGKIPNTKGVHYNPEFDFWNFGHLEKEWGKEFDIEILWCANNDRSNIERGYMIPKEKIHNRIKSISIIGSFIRFQKNHYWYEEYRITDEEFLNNTNKIYRKIKEEYR